MRIHKTWLRFAVPFGALLAASAAFAQQDTGKALLDLLVKKGIITQQEASDLQQQVASQPAPAAPAAPMAPAESAAPAAMPANVVTFSNAHGPLSLVFGKTSITPFGFLDMTGVYRSTLVGSGIGTSFGSIPYPNTNSTTIGPVSETRFSTQNSRLGLRVDSQIDDVSVLGYTEADFLGNAANNLTTVSNSDTLRMRVYFVDVKKGPWELLAGQDWSLLTPNRVGLSPIPSDIFYTQDMDTNYQVGLIWSRQPQIRLVYHASPEWTLGVSVENPDQYVGSAVTLPTANFNANQLDISSGSNSSGTTNANTFPDLIGKVAYDTKIGDLPFHAEASGVVRQYQINTYSSGGAINSNQSATGFGGSVNANIAVLPTVHLIGNGYIGDGSSRYISTGLGPDFVVAPANAAGAYTISLEHSYAAIGGVEWAVLPTTSIAGYYGVTGFSKDYFQTGATSYLGYGYPGSSNSNNKTIEEYTLDLTQTFWKSPSYGSLQMILQGSYLDRKPWYIATGSPSEAKDSMFFFDIRYNLP
jgi:hypothetical protein